MEEKKINLLNIYENYFCDEVNIYVNDNCNAKCEYCSIDIQKSNQAKKIKKEMSKKTFDNLLEQIRNNKKIKSVCFQGKEPSLWKHINYGINQIKKTGKKVIYYTNGINKKVVFPDIIVLHIDEDYLKNNIENLKYFRDFTTNNNIILSFVVVINEKSNISKYYKIITKYSDSVDLSYDFLLNYDLLDKLKISKTIKLFKMLNFIGFDVDLDIPIPYCLLSKNDYNFLIENKVYFSGTCYSQDIHQITPIIDCDGKASYPCIALKDRKDINGISLENLWKNHFKYLHSLRRKMPMKKCYLCNYYKNNTCHAGCLLNRDN